MKHIFVLLTLTGLLTACSKESFEHVEATAVSAFPKQLLLDEEASGELEDTDKAAFEIKLTDGIDLSGNELSGKPQVTEQPLTVFFELKDAEGFSAWGDYISGGTAYYEIDDCTTSEDLNIDLAVTFDPATGKGSFLFPAGVNSVKLELELLTGLMDDAVENSGDRGFTLALTGISETSENIVVNTDIVTEFRVYDDEKVCGDWTADPASSTLFDNIVALFSMANEDFDGLTIAETDAIDVSFAFDEFQLTVTLLETETVDECGTAETVPVEITVEGEMDEFDSDAGSGVIYFIVEREEANGSVTEIEYEGTFERSGNNLTLTLSGRDGDVETEELVLILAK